MTEKFKVGDVIKCIDDDHIWEGVGNAVKSNEVYTVRSIDPLDMVELEGFVPGIVWSPTRFVRVAHE